MFYIIREVLNNLLLIFSDIILLDLLFKVQIIKVKTRVIVYLLLVFILYLLPVPKGLFYILGFLVQLLTIFLCIKDRKAAQVMYALIVIILDSTFFAVSEMFYTQIFKNIEIIGFMCQGTTFIILLLARSKISEKGQLSLTTKKRGLLSISILLVIMTFYFPLSIINNTMNIDSVGFKITFAVFTFLSILSILITVAMYIKQDNENQFYQKEIILKEEVFKLQEQYVLEVIDSYKNIRIFKHDIRGHLQTIENLLLTNKNKEALQYIHELQEPIDIDSNQLCANIYISSILSLFTYKMKEQNIQFTLQYDIYQEINMNALHISSLFYNLMSNAIEAVTKVSNDKEIAIVVSRKDSHLVIEISNTVPDMFSLENITLGKTSKMDKENHGVGLISINEVISIYNGDIEYSISKSNLRCNIILLNVFEQEEETFE